jgi:hypothetical protein
MWSDQGQVMVPEVFVEVLTRRAQMGGLLVRSMRLARDREHDA